MELPLAHMKFFLIIIFSGYSP